jgi:two-component system, chemotaxis family, chemotaxis protein CheY
MPEPSEVGVLIVDDSPPVLGIISMIIQKEGAGAIYQAGDGKEALKMMKKYRPEIIFLDNMLPKISGMGVLEEVMRDYTGVKVIMVSAISSPAVITQALKLGAIDYIVKPFSTSHILEAFRKALAQLSEQ